MFQIRSRAATLPGHVSSSAEILGPALRLLRQEYPVTVRLLGIRCSGFLEGLEGSSVPGQVTLAQFLG